MRLALVVVTLAIGCATFSPEGTPVIGVKIGGSSDAPTFAPYYCDEPALSPQVFRITVQESVPGAKPPRVTRCVLALEETPSKRLPMPWTYGSKIPGFSVEWCERLSRGKTYVIEVLGAGAGVETFAVGQDGAITPVQDGHPCGMNSPNSPTAAQLPPTVSAVAPGRGRR